MIRKHRLGALALTVAGGALLYIGNAAAQAGLEFLPLAGGYNSENHVQLKSDGPSDVIQAKLSLQPASEIGWHSHPGPAIVIVTKGVLTEHHANGCVSLHPAGTAFFEEAGEVHNAVNQSATEAVEGYITLILPTGNPPLVPEATPATRACAPGHSN